MSKAIDKNIEKLGEYIGSPRKFIENFLYITTKEGTFIKFKLNKAQDELMTYIEECLEIGKPIRMRVLKSRQLGISTFSMALAFYWATMKRYQNCGLVAHNKDSTQSIFDKARIFYDNLPSWLQPKTNRFSSEAISYDYASEDGGGLKSGIFFGTAGGSDLFRGKTITFLHKSEKAFWEEPELLNKSLNATVPLLPNTFIIDETTANGYNFFKDEWDASKRGDNDYKPFFFGWDYDEKATMKVEKGFEFLPCEIEYMLLNDLTPEQMRWRRYTIVNDFGYSLADIENDDIDDFKQEYPLCVVGDTRIGTNLGLIKIEEAEKAEKGTYGDILRYIENPIQDIYELETYDGYTLKGTYEHPIKLVNGEFKKLGELTNEDIVELSIPKTAEEYHKITWKELGIEHNITIDEDMGRFLGYFLGDGSYSGGTLSFTCQATDDDILEKYKETVKNVFGIEPKPRKVGKNKNAIEYRITRKGLANVLKRLDVLGQDEHRNYYRKLRVPECIFRSSKSVIKEFLSALFDTDGFNDKNCARIVYFSKEKQFTKDVQLLLLTFGIKSRIKSRKAVNGKGYEYIANELILNGWRAIEFQDKIGFGCQRKIDRKNYPKTNGAKTNDLEDKVVSVKKVGREKTYNLTIKDINEFDANGIRTHNCDHEAFITSGRSVFNHKVIMKGFEYSKYIKPERYVIQSFPCNADLMVYERPEVIEEEEYDTKIVYDFEKRDYVEEKTDLLLGKNYRYANYVIGIDTSGAGQDRNVISVWHTNKKRKVAQWIMQNISEENLAKVAVEIAKLYHNAVIAPEINFSHSLVDFILKLDYDRIYIRENTKRIDKRGQALEYGWQTTNITKPLIVSYMKMALNEDYTICPDREFWDEAEYFIQEKTKSGNDTYGASYGHHDDVVMASMIARYVCDSLGINQGYTLSKYKHDYEPIKSGIIIGRDMLVGKKPKKNKFEKGVFRNNA